MMAKKKNKKSQKTGKGWFSKNSASPDSNQQARDSGPVNVDPIDATPEVEAVEILDPLEAASGAEDVPAPIEVPPRNLSQGDSEMETYVTRRFGRTVFGDELAEESSDGNGVDPEGPSPKRLDEIMDPVAGDSDVNRQPKALVTFGEGLGDSFRLSQDHIRVLAAVVDHPGINKGGLEGVSTATRDATRVAIRDLIGSGLVKRVVNYPSVQHFFHNDEPES